MVLKMDSLSTLSSEYGREAGDEVLKNFAMILKSFGDLYGFVGYNGGGVFYAFFPLCPSAKLDVIVKAIERETDKHNRLSGAGAIRCVCGRAVSGADGVYDIRDLLRLAMPRMHGGYAFPAAGDGSEKAASEGAPGRAGTETA